MSKFDMRNIPQRLNNPGDLVYAGQHEATGFEEHNGLKMAVFPTPEAGLRALLTQIELDQKRHESLRQFAYKYDGDSQQKQYLNRFMNEFKVNENYPINMLSAYALLGVIISQEGYLAKT